MRSCRAQNSAQNSAYAKRNKARQNRGHDLNRKNERKLAETSGTGVTTGKGTECPSQLNHACLLCRAFCCAADFTVLLTVMLTRIKPSFGFAWRLKHGYRTFVIKDSLA